MAGLETILDEPAKTKPPIPRPMVPPVDFAKTPEVLAKKQPILRRLKEQYVLLPYCRDASCRVPLGAVVGGSFTLGLVFGLWFSHRHPRRSG